MQLTPRRWLALAALFLSSPARAEAPSDVVRSAEAAFRVYADDDRVTVLSPSAAAHAPLGRRGRLDVSAEVDAISATSVDVVTSPSPSTVHDLRIGGAAAASLAAGDASTVSARVSGSRENDYRSLLVGGGLGAELARRTTLVDLALAASFDDVGKRADASFSRGRQSWHLTASWTQVLDRRTYLDVVADGLAVLGYQANPYRSVPIESATTSVLRVDEAIPSRRLGLALVGRLRRAIDARGHWFATAEYRFYADEWSVRSHTAGAQLLLSVLGDRLTVGGLVRGYAQGSADFYADRYVDLGAGAPALRTRDRTLGGMSSLHAALTVDVALTRGRGAEAVRVIASGGVLELAFDRYPPQAHRRALLLTLGAAAPF